jgi:O-antigen/teichoic acid export membrane protein
MNAAIHARRLTRPFATPGTATMVFGTVIAAAAAYGFQLVAGRALGPEEFAPITVLWTMQFLVFTTVFLPMEQLTIRRLSATHPEPPPRMLFTAVIGTATIVVTGFAAVTLNRLLAGQAVYLAVVALLIVSYGGFALARGSLAGRHRFADYGWTTMAESVARLGVAVVVIIAGFGVVGVAWALIPGALVIYAWRPFRVGDAAPSAAPATTGTGAALAAFVTANAASQTIVAAGPLLVASLGGGPAEVSVFFETFLLFRAPLTVAYNLIARVLPPFTRAVETGDRDRLARWAMQVGAVTAVVAGGGYIAGRVVGPGLVALFLGEEFRPSAALAAFAIAGVVIATAALFVQQMLVALQATSKLALCWFGGLAAAAVTIFTTTGSASHRVGLAFLIGEGVALVLIVAAVRADARRRP